MADAPVEQVRLTPPQWLIRREVESVVRRRLGTARVALVRDLVGTTADKVQFHIEAKRDYALFALYPPSENRNLQSRVRRFGQAFPGLFSINGIPRPHDVRKETNPEMSFIGGVQTRSLAAPILWGEDFRSTILTDCFLQVVPDTAIALAHLVIRSTNKAPRRFAYRIYFTFIMSFGKQASVYEFGEHLERVLVRFLEEDSGQQSLTENLVVHGSAA